MPRGLTKQQQAYVKEVFEELQRKIDDKVLENQTVVGKRIDVDQSSFSRICKTGQTSLQTALKAARLAGRSQEEIGRRMGIDMGVSPAQPTVVLDRVHEVIVLRAKVNGYSEEVLTKALAVRSLQGLSSMSEEDADELLELTRAFLRSASRIGTAVHDAGGSALDDLGGGIGGSPKTQPKRRRKADSD